MSEKVITDGPFKGLLHRHYGCIVSDPPWAFRSYAPAQNPHIARNPDRHYDTMDLDAIKALPVREFAAPACHLFMWVTGPHLENAFDVIRAWGFRYSGIAFTWVKLKRSHNPHQLRILPSAEGDLHVGLGFTTRKNAEICLLARRGGAKRAAKDVREVILAPVREHSRKPEEARDRIERYCGPDVSIIELFARSTRPGWASWGNQTSLFSSPEKAHADSLRSRGSGTNRKTLEGGVFGRPDC
jgi:N6-adenosine-specific RNA methylase IME4